MPYTPMASVIICSLNGADRLPMCFEALAKTTHHNHEVILVDNGSTDGTSEVAARWPRVKVLRADRNLGFAGGNNLGLRQARGDFFVLLNDDTEVEPGWLEPLAEAAMTLPDWGILGCLLVYPDRRTVQHAGARIEPNGLTQHFGYGEPVPETDLPVQRVPYVTGAAFAINRPILGLLGPLDDAFWPIYFEETDLCWRAAEIGYASYLVPASRVVHHESMTTDRFSPGFLRKYHRNRWRFMIKNFSRRELLRALRAELRWLRCHRPSDHYLPLLSALLSTLIRLPSLLMTRLRSRRRLWWIRKRLGTRRRDPWEPMSSPLSPEPEAT
jgi:GT2 family glycosyltransferase